VIKSDPRGSYKPSRLIDLNVDGEPKTAVFQLRETQTTLAWEVKPAVYVPLVIVGSSHECAVVLSQRSPSYPSNHTRLVR